MKKIMVMALIIVTVCAGFVFADTVVLKSGKKIEGKITERKTDLIMVDVEGVGVPYFLDEIAEINGEKVVPPAPVVVPVQPTVNAPPAKSVLGGGDDASFQGASSTNHASVSIDTEKMEAQNKIIATIVGVVMGILFLVYIYTSLCLFFIAKKVAKEPAWLAWVPIGNLFLMCKIGGIRYWWLLVLLLSLVPYMGVFTAAGFSAFAWWHIAQARGKPSWLGLLTILPIVNLGIMGYLAFSE